MNNELLLMSGADIPFISAQVNIHQPTIYEISLIGEESFFSGCQFLNFNKNMIDAEDNLDLTQMSDFEVFMSIMQSSEGSIVRNNVLMVLTLIFPTYRILLEDELILLDESKIIRINDTNYDEFKDILVSMFNLNENEDGTNGNYNPIDNRASKIAEKLRKAKAKKAEKNGDEKIAILSRYVSILAVGEHKDINSLMRYTVFQLNDEFKRFQMKQSFDIYMQAKMAGATGLDEVDHWMDKIHS